MDCFSQGLVEIKDCRHLIDSSSPHRDQRAVEPNEYSKLGIKQSRSSFAVSLLPSKTRIRRNTALNRSDCRSMYNVDTEVQFEFTPSSMSTNGYNNVIYHYQYGFNVGTIKPKPGSCWTCSSATVVAKPMKPAWVFGARSLRVELQLKSAARVDSISKTVCRKITSQTSEC